MTLQVRVKVVDCPLGRVPSVTPDDDRAVMVRGAAPVQAGPLQVTMSGFPAPGQVNPETA